MLPINRPLLYALLRRRLQITLPLYIGIGMIVFGLSQLPAPRTSLKQQSRPTILSVVDAQPNSVVGDDTGLDLDSQVTTQPADTHTESTPIVATSTPFVEPTPPVDNVSASIQPCDQCSLPRTNQIQCQTRYTC